LRHRIEREAPRQTKPLGFCKKCLAASQFLLGDTALRNILNRANILDRATFLVPAGLRHHANVFDRAVRHQQAMLVSKIAGATSYLGDLLLQHRYIFGMIARADLRKRYARSGLKLVNTIDFLGAYRVVRCRIEQEAASQTETLSFREKCLAALERSLGLQPFDCDARDV